MQITYKKTFEKRFKKLPEKVKNHFYSRLTLFMSSPFDGLLNNHQVDRAYPDCRSINITGDYRAIYYEQGRCIYFILIGRHSELYK